MKLLSSGMKRGGIPLIPFLLISLWFRFQELTALSHNVFFYGVIVFFLGTASIVYEVRQWSFKKQILIHYWIMLVTVYPTLLLSGFYPRDSFRDLVNVFFVFNMAGVILFFTTYLVFRWRNRNHHA